MKTTGFSKRDYFGLGILAQLFNRPQNKKKSNSLEDLKQEISNSDYIEKVKFLIEQDLLLKYSPTTVQKGLEDLSFKIIFQDVSHLELVKKEEPVSAIQEEIQEQSTPVVRINETLSDEKQQEVWKVQSRIPKWFNKPQQINSRILIAYMNLLGDNKSVPLHKLESVCRKIKTFQNNYNQMKTFGERNHAKVFEETGGRVILWEPVRNFIVKEYKQFQKRNKY